MVVRGLRRTVMACGLTVVASLAAGPGGADTITLLADEWCPYNCEPGSERPGFMVEIAEEALALAGHQVVYETLNWTRSLHRAATGEVDGVIGAIPEEAPDFIFGTALGSYVDTVAVRKGEAFDPYAPGALEGKVIGAINGYEYVGPIAEYIDAHRDDPALVQFANGSDPLEQNLKKLIAGRIDAIAEVKAVVRHKLAELGYQDQIDVIEASEGEPIFIAFSPVKDTSPGYADALAAGLEHLRQSGRLEEIMQAYGLEPTD